MNAINNKLLVAIMALSVPYPLLADTIEDGRYWFALTTQGKLPVQIETVYLNQYVNTRNTDRVNHVLATTLRLNF